MKHILLLTLFFGIFGLTSCNKDGVPNSGDLSGTTWKYTYPANDWDEYTLLIFKSKTTFELWDKPYGSSLEKDGEGIYYIEGSTITINNGEAVTGTIDKKTITFVADGNSSFLQNNDNGTST